MKWYNRIQRFMVGRYGMDDLYGFLFGIYILIFILNIFINNKYLTLFELLIVIIMFYRFFSKKIYKRSNENKKYLKFKNKLLRPFKNIKRNIMDEDYIYKKCRNCKKTLRLPLPYERGIKHTKCPNCKKKLTIFVLKKQKVEIIKNSN